MSIDIHSSDLMGQRQIRIEKAQQLKRLGIDSYPTKSRRDHSNKEIFEDYQRLEGTEVTVAGRVMTLRDHGKLVFANIQDPTGTIQLYIKQEELSPTSKEAQIIGFSELGLIDIGDIVEAVGTVTKTQRGEISVQVKTLRMLTKALRPLPEKWSGIKDKETVYRRRYLDTIMDPNKKWRFEKGAQIVFAMREFLNNRGFLELKTPILQPIYGGGTAKPFETYVNALNTNAYLAIAHELYLKRLITAGFENVYNMTGYFRNEGIDRAHNPEFQMLETMTAFKNYEFNMDLVEEMYKYIAQKVFDRTMFKIRGQEVDFGQRWERIMMIDTVKKYSGYDFNEVTSLEEAHKILDKIGFEGEKPGSIGEAMVEVFSAKVEEQLIQPTFVYGHPVEISPLAKRMPNNPKFVERFEIFIGGVEGGDNWTELNDPLELYERFKDQVERGRHGLEEFHPMDVDFIETMEYGMPPTTGLGPGIERLIMMFTDTEYIDDVIFFPILKPAPVTQQQKDLYGEGYLVSPKKQGTGIEPVAVKSQDRSKKMVIVLNKEVGGWQLTNTIGHIAAYLGSRVGEELTSRPTFTTADKTELPANAQFGIVTLSANPGQLYNLLQKIEEAGLEHIAYIQEMIDFIDDEELARALTKKKKEELNYLGIGVVGEIEEIDLLTKKFSLWKG